MGDFLRILGIIVAIFGTLVIVSMLLEKLHKPQDIDMKALETDLTNYVKQLNECSA